jgi:hypothetical protein
MQLYGFFMTLLNYLQNTYFVIGGHFEILSNLLIDIVGFSGNCLLVLIPFMISICD